MVTPAVRAPPRLPFNNISNVVHNNITPIKRENFSNNSSVPTLSPQEEIAMLRQEREQLERESKLLSGVVDNS